MTEEVTVAVIRCGECGKELSGLAQLVSVDEGGEVVEQAVNLSRYPRHRSQR